MQFRIGLDFRQGYNAAGLKEASLIIADTQGRTATVKLSAGNLAAQKMPGRPNLSARLLLNAIQIPLSEFSNIDRASIKSIELRFPGTGKGRVVLADLIALSATDQ